MFVCTNTRASGKPACGLRGADELIARVQHGLLAAGAAANDLAVTACACLGPCFDGPNAVVYPDAIWYGALTPDDAPGIVAHLLGGEPLAARVIAADRDNDGDGDQ